MLMSDVPWSKKGNLEAIGFQVQPPTGSNLDYALRYAAIGWPVLPLHTVSDGRCSCGQPGCSSPGKHPRTQHGLKDASTDRDTITAWFERWPDSNIGIVTGKASGVWALDVDVKGNGIETLEELIDRHGALPDTPMAVTGSGGQHWLFRYQPGVRNRGKFKSGLDVRGEGGYIAVEPSIHLSGNAYAWEASSDPLDGVAVLDAPQWLLDLVLAETPKPAQAQASGLIGEGGRNNALTSLAGTLRRSGVSQAAIEAALQEENAKRCSPPLPTAEVSRIAWSIARHEPAEDYGELAQVDTSQLIDSLKGETQVELSLICAADWAGEPTPEREWLVPDWMPMRQTTALYAKGGTGKTLAAQQLLTAVSTGGEWMGLKVRKGTALGLFCEDDAAELQRRQEAINTALGLAWGDLSRLHILPRVGHDNILMNFDSRGHGALTPFWHALNQAVETIKPTVLIVDTAADTFGGNENIRPQVRQYVQQALTQIATQHGCAVVLCAHPSASGVSSGEGTGGSTAWENSVRSRLYMDRNPDTHVITLTRKKSNYSATGEAIDLAYHEGTIKPLVNIDALIDSTTDSLNQRIERDFFRLLDHVVEKQGQKVSASKNGNYAPKVFTQIGKHLKPAVTWSQTQFEGALNRLLDQGRLVSAGDSKRGKTLSRPHSSQVGSSGECSVSD